MLQDNWFMCLGFVGEVNCEVDMANGWVLAGSLVSRALGLGLFEWLLVSLFTRESSTSA